MEVNLNNIWSNPDSLGNYGQQPNVKPPFRLYVIPDLLTDTKTVNQLRDDVNSAIKLKTKDNDLYKFKQSKDLKTEMPAKRLTPLIHEFIDAMLGKIRIQLEKITNKKLSSKNFDITASRYDVGDYLLCHNDDIKDNIKKHGRTLAFIYYLNARPWTSEDGGALIIYNSDSQGEPYEINNRILPRPNTLILFDTSSTSWHSVEEVFCKDDFRLSINGWFHTDGPCRLSNDDEKIIELSPYEFYRPIYLDERIEKFIKECINDDYLNSKTWIMIKKRFKKKSEINLSTFLVKHKFQEICEALKEATKQEENLTRIGPYNKRNYKVLKLDKLPQICRDLFDVFRSEPFFLLLSQMTGLDLQPPSKKYDNGNNNKPPQDDEEQSDEDDEDEESDETGLEDSESDSDEEEDEDDDEEEEDEEESEGVDQDKKKPTTSTSEGSGRLSIDEANTDPVGEASVKPETSKRSLEAPTTSKDILEEVKKSPLKRKRTSNPIARLEFRHLERGSYTLIHDHAFELGEKSALDVILHFNHEFQVNFDHGGYISYIDAAPEEDPHDMDCELLTVDPKSNCLSLVYRCDEGTCRFLKHINKSHKSNYQDLYCVYYERPDDLPNYKTII